MCQPLDVAFFRPLKICWRQCLQEWKTKNKGTIPKSVFPRLLNQTLKKLEPAIAKNLQSGFRGTGIFPLNPEEVLKRLPGSTEHIAHRLSDSFEKYLREIRFESSTSKKRKRRLNVEAGKSVNETCFQARSDSDPASENGGETENNEVDREVNIQNALSTETMNLKVGDFIVGKISFSAPSKKAVNKFYVGLIQSVNDDTYLCKLMRKSCKCDKTFLFPVIDNVWNFEEKDIVEVLRDPVVVRGRHRFTHISSSVMLQ